MPSDPLHQRIEFGKKPGERWGTSAHGLSERQDARECRLMGRRLILRYPDESGHVSFAVGDRFDFSSTWKIAATQDVTRGFEIRAEDWRREGRKKPRFEFAYGQDDTNREIRGH